MKGKFQRVGGPFAVANTYLSIKTNQVLKKRAEEMGLPISKLIAIAIDNELDAPVPFNYPCLLPSNIFIEGAYVAECQRIARYLIQFPSGTGRETLMLHRRDMEIPDRDTFMLAYRELLKAGVIEEVAVPKKSKFDYPVGYRYTKLVNIDKSEIVKHKKKRLQEQMERLQAKMAEVDDDEEGEQP